MGAGHARIEEGGALFRQASGLVTGLDRQRRAEGACQDQRRQVRRAGLAAGPVGAQRLDQGLIAGTAGAAQVDVDDDGRGVTVDRVADQRGELVARGEQGSPPAAVGGLVDVDEGDRALVLRRRRAAK